MKAAIFAVVTAAFLTVLPQPGIAGSIKSDTVWSGSVTLSGTTVVEEGATLTVEPGTTVMFAAGEPDEEGLAQSGILVRGRMTARGGPGRKGRIRFTSAAEKPAPGDWGEIKFIGSGGSEFSGCDFSYGGWGIHTHDSALTVIDCTFANNSFGGVRGKGGEVEISGSTFRGMELGVRYWLGSPNIHGNTITGNDTGIFFRKDCEGASVHGNNIYDNRDYDFKLGDAQEKDVDVSGNWWGTADPAAIKAKIFDRDREPYIGRALIEPVLTGMVAVPAADGEK